MAKILCAGIAVLDEVFRVHAFPMPDTKVQASELITVGGGNAANAAVAIIGVDSGHMGVKVRRAVAQRRHSQRVSDEIAAVIGAEHLSTSVRRNDEHG